MNMDSPFVSPDPTDAARLADLTQAYDTRPSPLRYMLQAMLPRPPLADTPPPILTSWSRHQVDRCELARFSVLTGLPNTRHLSLLYPLTFGFPLVMAAVTHPSFPLSIWSVLQIRNHVAYHRAIATSACMNFKVQVTAQRVLSKGVEIDLHTTVSDDEGLAWESIVTFYSRGHFHDRQAPGLLAKAPQVEGEPVASWRMPTHKAWAFARFTGDYNGIHRWDWYARLFGFRAALYHPSFVLGQCLSRLDPNQQIPPLRLDLWLKGPVYRGVRVSMVAQTHPASGGTDFALSDAGARRPSVIGRLSRRSGGVLAGSGPPG